MENNENHTVCSECGGCCCQKIPGAYIPSQLSVKQIVDGVKKKRLKLWRMDGVTFPRPRNTPVAKYTYDEYEISRGNCMYLGEKGCKLDFDSRPHECKGLIPSSYHCQHVRGTSLDAIEAAWRKSNKMEQALAILGPTISKEK
jgi:Fe-S-cluster containining protein